MFDEGNIITIDGNYAGEYYMTDSQVVYLTKDFKNTSGETIYLYDTDSNAYITISRDQTATYRSTGYNSYTVEGVTQVDFNAHAHYIRERPYLSLLFVILAIAYYLRRLITRG